MSIFGICILSRDFSVPTRVLRYARVKIKFFFIFFLKTVASCLLCFARLISCDTQIKNVPFIIQKNIITQHTPSSYSTVGTWYFLRQLSYYANISGHVCWQMTLTIKSILTHIIFTNTRHLITSLKEPHAHK